VFLNRAQMDAAHNRGVSLRVCARGSDPEADVAPVHGVRHEELWGELAVIAREVHVLGRAHQPATAPGGYGYAL
jgi:hypothetical protein